MQNYIWHQQGKRHTQKQRGGTGFIRHQHGKCHKRQSGGLYLWKQKGGLGPLMVAGLGMLGF